MPRTMPAAAPRCPFPANGGPSARRGHGPAAPIPRPLAACTLALALAACGTPSSDNPARVSVETRVLDTYPFSDPNPVPILARDRRLYPYHSFEGYAATSEPREWKVVKMENDLIEVFVLPEVGGKVWGAVVKATGDEFIYRNDVVKFRDIALRGPWTSGGIEFNFGVIGHTPATATPVDHMVRENEDGSASAFVGAMDLPSRTHWRVEIRLPADKAYFETRALWYNPTPLEQPYYNWMTAAAFAQDDLELFVPGGSYLEHSGRERTWPADEDGRFLPLYRNNDFGGNKSYHVVGELNDFFGGYYHDDGYGWGHWSPYEEMPGQKMWLWALSRAGGVWEDLLTDDDGQYVEFQAGRLLVQYSPGDHRNPVTQAAFDPLSASRWTESWFPLVGTGGLTDASREGAMHVERVAGEDGVERADDVLGIALHAFADTEDTLRVWVSDDLILERSLDLAALQPLIFELSPVSADAPVRVELPNLGLAWDSDPAERALSRPFETDPAAWASIPEADRLAFEARELARGRRYAEARKLFDRAAALEPWNREALLGLGSLALRSGRYEEGLAHARRALQLDTYDAGANFLAGNLHRALGRRADARDSFGWAARAVGFRAAANIQLAEIMTGMGDWSEAERYARLAIDFDRRSVPAWQSLAVAGRRTGNDELAARARAELLAIDPLHHFVLAERYLADPSNANRRAVADALGGEFPEQTLLELAIGHANRGLPDDALTLLALADDLDAGPLTAVWRAFLARDATASGSPDEPESGAAEPGVRSGVAAASPSDAPVRNAPTGDELAFVFPFRPETLAALRWVAAENPHWSWRYLLGLNLWALDRDEEAAATLAALADEPDYGPVYAARAHLLQAVRGVDPAPDLARAVALAPGDRILRVERLRHLQEAGRWADALAESTRALGDFPGDFNLALLHVRSLLAHDRGSQAVAVLAETTVLPSENAAESHRLYALAQMAAAVEAMQSAQLATAREHLSAALLWPETLGQGRPYEPDERLVHYLSGVLEEMEGDPLAAARAWSRAAGMGPRDAGASSTGGATLEPRDLVSPGGGFFAELEERLVKAAEGLRGAGR